MASLNLDIPVIGILRGVEPDYFAQVMETSFKAGLQAMEVTLNTENALDIIRENRPGVPERKFLGAGTVCNIKDAEQAIDAGAMFLVTPNLDTDVIKYAGSENIPVVAGALTPSEIYTAWAAGAAMIKVFPCKTAGGPEYIKELCGPFDSIPLAAVGGVSFDNLHDYFAAGAQAVGVSTSLFGKKALADRDLEELAENVKAFISRVKEVY